MIYPIRQHIKEGEQIQEPQEVYWAMDGESRAVQIQSESAPRIDVPDGVTVTVKNVDSKEIVSGEWFDKVGGNAQTGMYLIDITCPGPGEYDLIVNGSPLTIYVSDVPVPSNPTLPFLVGTQQNATAERDAFYERHGANEPEENFEVATRFHNRLLEFRMQAELPHWQIWMLGYDPVVFGTSYTDNDCQFAYPEIANSVLESYEYGWVQKLNYHQFTDRQGQWKACGVRQGMPEFYENAVQVYANMKAAYPQLRPYVDEPGTPAWTDEALVLLKESMQAAHEADNPFAVTISDPGSFSNVIDAGITDYIGTAITRIDEQPLSLEQQSYISQAEQWGYTIWAGVSVDGRTARTDAISSRIDQYSPEQLVMRCFERDLKGMYYWMVAKIYDNYHPWQYQDSWWDATWLYSMRFWRWREALHLHDWLVAAAEMYDKETLLSYLEGFEGEDIRYMLYELCKQAPPSTTTFDEALRAAANEAQCISPNPDAALQKVFTQDGQVWTSNEFDFEYDGIEYVAQRTEMPTAPQTPEIYYAVKGDWGNVKHISAEEK